MQRCGYKNILGVLNRFLARTPKPVTSLYQDYRGTERKKNPGHPSRGRPAPLSLMDPRGGGWDRHVPMADAPYEHHRRAPRDPSVHDSSRGHLLRDPPRRHLSLNRLHIPHLLRAVEAEQGPESVYPAPPLPLPRSRALENHLPMAGDHRVYRGAHLTQGAATKYRYLPHYLWCRFRLLPHQTIRDVWNDLLLRLERPQHVPFNWQQRTLRHGHLPRGHPLAPDNDHRGGGNAPVALSRRIKATGTPNFNHLSVLSLNRDMADYCAERIRQLSLPAELEAYRLNWQIYFSPSSHYVTPNEIVVRLPWRERYDKLFSTPFLPAALGIAFILSILYVRGDSITRHVGLLLPGVYIFAVSVLGERGENMRLKIFLEPLFYLFIIWTL